jgi:hypothetical protein
MKEFICSLVFGASLCKQIYRIRVTMNLIRAQLHSLFMVHFDTPIEIIIWRSKGVVYSQEFPFCLGRVLTTSSPVNGLYRLRKRHVYRVAESRKTLHSTSCYRS